MHPNSKFSVVHMHGKVVYGPFSDEASAWKHTESCFSRREDFEAAKADGSVFVALALDPEND